MTSQMKHALEGVGQVWAVNGLSIAAITLTDIKEAVAIVLGIVSIISTIVIIRRNLSNRVEK